MRLVSYHHDGAVEAGFLVGDLVVPAHEVLAAAGPGDAGLGDAEPGGGGQAAQALPRPTVRSLLELGPERCAQLASAAATVDSTHATAVSRLHLTAPILDPDKILCIGLNYRDHAEETGMAEPDAPIVFAKFRNSLVGPSDDIIAPPVTRAMDYEAELAVVIGRRGRDIPTGSALEHLAGVMAFNDVSARDLQMQTSQWTIGKAIDTFAPCGPALVGMDEIEDIQNLKVSARVNGQTVQAGTTASMIFTVAEIISYLSQVMTLQVGDIIATGTPAGVGYTRNPPLRITPGDLVEIDIEGVGLLANRVVAQPSPT